MTFRVWLAILPLVSCTTAPTASPDAPNAAAVAPLPPAPPPNPPPPEPVGMPREAYTRSFLSGASTYFRGRRTTSVGTSSSAPAHDIVVVRKIGRDRSHVIFTSGLGRIPRPDRALPAEHQNIELVAYSKDVGSGIGEVLSVLGAHLHGRLGARWKTYDAVRLPSPVNGLQHFDLRPGGEIDVSDDLRVTLYKVVPLAPDEMARTESEGGSQWVDSGAADPAAAAKELLRWAPALRAGPTSD